MNPGTPSILPRLFSHALVAIIAAFAGSQWIASAPPSADAVSPSVPTTEAPLFRVGERQYGYFDLPIEYRQPLHEVRKFAFEQQLMIIEDALVEAYIQQQMAQQNSDRMTVQGALMPGAEPSEEEILRFYQENQSQSAPPLERIRGELETYLTAAKQEQLKKELLTRLLVSGDAQMLAEAPQLEKSVLAQD